MTDYGTLLLVHLARRPGELTTAGEVAAATGVALPTAQKLLKLLARAGLIESVRGVDGGYRLARLPERITATEILDVLEGPVAITECSTTDSRCELEAGCRVGGAWQQINKALRRTLDDISLADLGHLPGGRAKIEYAVPADSLRHRTD